MTNAPHADRAPETWARWLGWTWVVLLLLGALAVLLDWPTLRLALDLQNLLG
jgi:hypothetical protein